MKTCYRTVAAALASASLLGCTPEKPGPAVHPVGEAVDMLSQAGRLITTEAPEGAGPRYDPLCEITPTSIAGLTSPATLGEFAAAFPAGSTLVFEPYYMVELGTLCLVEGGSEKVCTWFFVYDTEQWDPDAEATGLFTRSDDCRTADGIGPGTPVSDATEHWGEPAFSFDYDNEGREYLSFADAPDAYGFRAASAKGEAIVAAGTGNPSETTPWPNGEFGGDYAASATRFSTDVPLDDAVIAAVHLR